MSPGTQPGDPRKAAEAIIMAVALSEPPALLLRGSDSVAIAAAGSDAGRAEADTWHDVSFLMP